MASGVEGAMVYVASKAVHAPRWRALRDAGHPIGCTWIDEAGPGETRDWADLWRRCVAEASRAAVTIAYREPGEELKGVRVEVGATLAHGGRVIVVGPLDDTWQRHPAVERAGSVEAALERAASILAIASDPLTGLRRPTIEEAIAGGEAVALSMTLAIDRDGRDEGPRLTVRRWAGRWGNGGTSLCGSMASKRDSWTIARSNLPRMFVEIGTKGAVVQANCLEEDEAAMARLMRERAVRHAREEALAWSHVADEIGSGRNV